jgi:hypothetical protein
MLTVAATRILVGLVLLLFGRRLFWLFVGAVGFAAGAKFANEFMPHEPDDFTIIFSLVVGLLSAVLAVAVRKIALGAAGFLAGGYLLTQALAVSGQESAIFAQGLAPAAPWITFIVGGLLGAVLMNVLFTWTLILLSALGGSALICESVRTSSTVLAAAFTILAILGVLIQSGLIRRQLPRP